MASKPMIIIAVLFIATLASAVSGYAYYRGYAAAVSGLARQAGVVDLLQATSYLKYQVTSPNDGTFIVTLENDPARGYGKLTYAYENGTAIAVYEFTYSNGVITAANRTDPATGETTGVPANEMERLLLSPFEIETQSQGASITVTGVKPSPGLAPLTLPHVLADQLQIDWKRARSPLALVRVRPVDFEFNGSTWKGVAVLVEPRTPLPTNPWSQLTSVSFTATSIGGVSVVVEAGVVAGQDTLTIKLISFQPARG